MEIVTEDTIAVIVAIEDYQFFSGRTGINSVKFAKNDAIAFKELLINEFEIDDENIELRLEGDATKAWLENELPYIIRNLSDDDKFIFYYAGHGFYQDGTNRLTAWDSHPFNLQDTTVSLKQVLFDPIEKSECDKSLIFIDACARELRDIIKGRDLISTMNKAEFEKFIEDKSYRAVFCSCSPGEKSFSSNKLKHGIWTWHLIESLAGRMNDAIVRDFYITDASLKDFLSYAVPKFIRKNTGIRSTQIPYAVISSTNTFEIRKLPEAETSAELPKLILDYEEAYLRNIETENISNLDGFNKKKGHFIPADANAFADGFVKKLLDDDIREELKDIYDNAKKILKLKHRDIDKDVGDGGGTVENEYFRYYLDVEQNPGDYTEALTTKRLIIRVKLSELPDNFNDIFAVNLDEIVIPISGNIDFDELVDGFENLEDAIGGRLEEEDDEGMIEYTSADGQIKFTIQIYKKS